MTSCLMSADTAMFHTFGHSVFQATFTPLARNGQDEAHQNQRDLKVADQDKPYIQYFRKDYLGRADVE